MSVSCMDTVEIESNVNVTTTTTVQIKGLLTKFGYITKIKKNN